MIAVNPQATLSRKVTLGWENRFKPAWHRDFEEPYGYGPDGVRSAGKVWLFYDPAIPADAMHATLYIGNNIEKIRCRHMGHGMLSTWRHMGVLSTIIKGCIEGTMSKVEIYALLTARTRNPFYQKRVLEYLLRRNRPYWVSQYCRAVIEDCKPQQRPHFRRAMLEADRKLSQS